METLAEQPVYTETFEELIAEESWDFLVLPVPELAIDAISKERAARFIGAALIGATVETEGPKTEKPIESLFAAIHEAARGDSVARKLVEINVSTDVVERTLKTGHVGKMVPLQVSEDGKLTQFRQSMESIQANSLRMSVDDPVMQSRTKAETRNSFRTEYLNREGWFDAGYSLLVISPAENRPDIFYTETMSCSLQLTRKMEDRIMIEPAFVSGVKTEGAARHDLTTIAAFGSRLGVDLADKNPAEIIDTPILIHNSLIPNGVVDVVRLYDDAAGGTFFGENRLRKNYVDHLGVCRKREESFLPTITRVTEQLIDEAQTIISATQAVERLNALSAKNMLELATVDHTIDARVFGVQAAYRIEHARYLYEMNEPELAQRVTTRAVAVETSISCPTALTKSTETAKDGKSNSSSAEKPKDCDFISKKCPVCGEKNAKTRVRNGTYLHVGKSCRG